MKTKILIAAVVVILIYSCSPKITPQVTDVKAVKEVIAETEVKEVKAVKAVKEVVGAIGMLTPEMYEGKTLYENNCASCHKLYETKAFSVEEWQPILKRMQKKAKLQDADMEKINTYLTSN